MSKPTVKFVFENEKAAEHFKVWMCEEGEQIYREWMECREVEEDGDITGVAFDYNESNTVIVECGRLDDED